ncbi:MAG: sigma-54 dependent transcriptional regulator, partial [Planctomycetes bacterium]|nr:sigma-54 dependent transcriptional regulator [Planctomycetota bacterium]
AAHQAMDASGMVGASAVMRELFADVARLAPTDVTILIEGESGTGKELVASALQRFGARSTQPFVVENCGALPDTLLESELFGHVKGAFTGATSDKAGRFEQADGGTLFLDEIGEMSEAMQQRLLRVLQEGEVRRLGSSELIQVDVRVLAATNRDLHAEVQAGRFREDLFYRLKVVSLELPALREREGDIELLAEHFLALEAADFGCPQRTLSGPALTALQRAHWPGNVRQLRHEIRRLTVLAEGEITFQELSTEITDQLAMVPEVSHDGSLPSQVDRLERTAIENALSLHEGNRNAAADTLGITRYALKRKMKKLGLVEDLSEE